MAQHLTPEIRSKISELDGLAQEIKDFFEDNYLQYEDSDPSLGTFHENLDSIQNAITELQEAQNWI